MISHLRGILEKNDKGMIVIDVNGIGYEVMVPVSTIETLPKLGSEVKVYITESTAMYGGNTTLYGFLTEDEKDIFSLLKDEVPGAGAKKSLEYMDKIVKSINEFKRVVISKDISSMISYFGFTKKTAEKLIVSLKDKMGNVSTDSTVLSSKGTSAVLSSEAVQGLVSLGYSQSKAREAVEKVVASADKKTKTEEIIKQALGYL